MTARPYFIHFNCKGGTFSAACFGWWFCIRAPWNRGTFSENYGGQYWLPLKFGWRCRAHKIKGSVK